VASTLPLSPYKYSKYNSSWIQATLPVRWDGLGVRSVVDLGPSAYLASSCLVRNLFVSILGSPALKSFDNFFSLALQGWESQGGVSIPGGYYVPCRGHGMTRFMQRNCISYFVIPRK